MQFTNTCLLTIAYFAVRIVFQSYLALYYVYPKFYKTYLSAGTYERVTGEGKNYYIYMTLGAYFMLVNSLSQLINFYWFHLIINQLVRNYKKFTGQKVEAYIDA